MEILGRRWLRCVKTCAIHAAAMLLVAWPCVAQEGGAEGTRGNAQNLQEILELAKQKVFPALVYVKPIVEHFDAGEKRKRQVFGSGVIIDSSGLVVTNNHVVAKAVRVHCVLYNKKQVPATILGRDPETDIAILLLEVPPEDLPLPSAEFADSDLLTEGDFVMALGSPFGFTRSISLGIISNTRRYLGFETDHKYNIWIQTDAAINPGNSGGPLVNTKGEIVGINTLGIFLADNIGFAIPSNVAARVVPELRKHGEVRRAWCGLKLQPLQDFFTNTFTEAENGVLVAAVEARSPAERAGIQRGDILLKIGDREINGTYAEDLPAVANAIAQLPIGAQLTAGLLRAGQPIALSIEPVLRSKTESDTFDCRRWNMALNTINRHKNPDLFFHRPEGVFVFQVRRPGNASSSGIRRNDIILSIDRKGVKNLEDIRSVYEEITSDNDRETKVLVEVLHDGYRKWVNLDYTKEYDEGR